MHDQRFLSKMREAFGRELSEFSDAIAGTLTCGNPLRSTSDDVVDYTLLALSERRRFDVVVVQAVLELRADIGTALLEEHRVHVTHRQIHDIIQRAVQSGNLSYKPEVSREGQIETSFGLNTATVVHGTGIKPIIRWAADSLRNMIWEIRRSRPAVGAPLIRVGVAGGLTVFNTLITCGELLENDDFDGQVVVVPMVPNPFSVQLDFGTPSWGPIQPRNTWSETLHLKETNYGGHNLPPMVKRARFERLMTDEKAIQDIVRSVSDLDVILTSGSSWDDLHGALQLRCHYPDLDKLRQDHNVVGELLWHPVTDCKPIGLDYVPVTALGPEGIDRLPDLIEVNGTRVLAVLGPCGVCNRRKTALVKSVLRHERRIITDLVTDGLTAEEIISCIRPGDKRTVQGA